MLKLFSFLILFTCALTVHAALNETTKPSQLTIYLDQNLPYSNFNTKQQAHGLLVDYWKLWSTNTDIPVTFSQYNNESLSYALDITAPSLYTGLLAYPENLIGLERAPLFRFEGDLYYLSSHKEAVEYALYNKNTPLMVGGLVPKNLQMVSLGYPVSIDYKEYPGLLELLLDVYNDQVDGVILFNGGTVSSEILDSLLSISFDKKTLNLSLSDLFFYTSTQQKYLLDWISWGNQLEIMPLSITNLLAEISTPIWFASDKMSIRLLFILTIIFIISVTSRSRRAKDREFKNILDSSPYPLAIISLHGSRIFYLNDEVKALINFKNIKNKYIFEEEENQKVFSDFISKSSHETKIEDQRLRILVDARFNDIEVTAKRIHYKHKTAWFCHFKDVTAQLRAERKLTEERELLRTVLDSIPEQISFKSPKGTVIGCNTAWATANNTTVKNATGRRINELLSADVIEKQKNQEAIVWLGDTFNKQEWIKQGNNKESLINFLKLPLYNEQGNIFSVLSIDSDITDFYDLNEQLKGENIQRKKTEKALSQQNVLLRTVFSASMDAIALLDHEGRVISANDAFAKFMNSNADNIIGKLQSELLPEDSADWTTRQNQEVLDSGQALIFEEIVFSEGEKICYEVQKSAFRDPESDYCGIVIVARDITQRKQTEEKLVSEVSDFEDKMLRDQLTGIANRRAFDLQFNKLWQEALEEHELLSVIMCDIDFFKPYNDNYGHQKGDQVLAEVGEILHNVCEELGCFVARYGGEEFVILHKGGNATSALKLGERIRSAIIDARIEHLYSSVSRIVTVSMGLSSLFPSNLNSIKILLAEADGALYLAKETGRDQICVH